MSLTKSIRHYFRLSPNSIQGKFTVLMLGVAAIVSLLFVYDYQLVIQQQERQQELLQVWYPTAQTVQELSIQLEAGKTDDQSFTPLTGKLNKLANQWQNQRMFIYQNAILEQVENYQAKASAAQQVGESVHALPEYIQLQKVLSLLKKEAATKATELEKTSESFKAKLKTILIIQVIGFFLLGLIAGYLVISSVLKKIRKLKNQISSISRGYLSESIMIEHDEFHSISKSLNQLTANLKEVTFFAGEVGHGNMDAPINAFEESSELGGSLSQMRDSLKQVAVVEKNRHWVNEGIAKFAEILRQHNQKSDELSEAVVGELVKYVGALQGALFLTQKEGNKTMLQMSGCYAYDRQKYLHKQIPADSGLIGQAYLEKAPKYLKEIPKNYDTITTGLGQGSPESILMIPLLHDNRVEGVLEMASLRQFKESELEFLNKIAESLGAAIANVRISDETRRLLEESKGVAEEMQAQEEEMRQNMEEMQATQEEMARAQKALSTKETNLNAFINNTTDSIITITRDYKVGLINEIQRARYKGTQYEGIDEGTDVLPTLGAVAQEWKGYYDRAFAGEQLDFVLKSSVKGEDAWREYIINPIKEKSGNVIGASVLSRDVTAKVQQEMNLQQKSAVLHNVVEQKADAYLALNTRSRIILASSAIKDLVPDLIRIPKENEQLSNLLPYELAEEWQQHVEKTMMGKAHKIASVAAGGEKVTLRFTPLFSDSKEVIAILVLASRV